MIKYLTSKNFVSPLLVSLLATTTLLFIFEYLRNERLDSKVRSQLNYIAVIKDYSNNLKLAYNHQKDEVAIKNKLIEEQSEQLTMLYTFHQAGIKAQTQEEIKELISLADLAPYGSPFTGGHIITSKYGVRDERWMDGDGFHNGTDLIPKIPNDRVVHALFDGYISDWGTGDPTYGKWVEYVNNTETFKVKYAHLSKIYWQDIDKRQVEMVQFGKGSRIGVMGDTGLTFGPHLHMEISVKTKDGEWKLLNPEEMIDYI